MTDPIVDLTHEDQVPAGASALYSCQLQDENGLPVSGVQLSTLTLSLIDGPNPNGPIVNSISKVNILNNDRGQVDQFGNVTILFQPADTLILRTTDLAEVRAIVLDWSWVTGRGTLVGRRQINFTVVALAGPAGA